MEEKKYHTYDLIVYTDVCGNIEDGYIVNDQMVMFKNLKIAEESDDKDVLTYLKKIGWLTTDDPDIISLDWDDFGCELSEAEDSFPLGRLIKIE